MNVIRVGKRAGVTNIVFIHDDDYAIVAAAGAAAVNYLHGSAGIPCGARGDFKGIVAKTGKGSVGQSYMDAAEIAQKKWPDVLMLAAALLVRGELSEAEIAAIVHGDTLPNAAAWWKNKPAGYWERTV